MIKQCCRLIRTEPLSRGQGGHENVDSFLYNRPSLSPAGFCRDYELRIAGGRSLIIYGSTLGEV